jgi:hypothetical protein
VKPQQIVILAFCILLLAAVVFGVVAFVTHA